jgi:outer membrane protein assembly factor BamB
VTGHLFVGEWELPPSRAVTVRKLDTADGGEVWRKSLGGPGYGGAPTVATDGVGDVFVATTSAAPDSRALVVKLDGRTAEERWRTHIPTRLSAFTPTLLLDPEGDVVAYVPSAVAVAKLDGASGTIRWFRDFAERPLVLRAALDARGDVLITGQREWGFYVARLARVTGRTLWARTLLRGRSTNASAGSAITAGGDGAVIAGGQFRSRTPEAGMTLGDFGVVNLCGRTGRVSASHCAPRA